MRIDCARLDPSRRAAFFRLHCEENDAGWCNCVAWWTPTWEGWGERTAEENRALRERLFDAGEYDGYLLWVDGDPAAWCQVGPRDRLSKLVSEYHLEPDPDAWAVTCFVIPPRRRGKGLAHRLLEDVLADLRAHGVARVEAFPRRGEGLPPDDVWTGPEHLFARAGFVLARDHPANPIYVLSLR